MTAYQILALVPPVSCLLYILYCYMKTGGDWLFLLAFGTIIMLPNAVATLLLWGFPYGQPTPDIIRASVWAVLCILYTNTQKLALSSSAESGGQAAAMFFLPFAFVGIIALVFELVLFFVV